MTGKNDDTQGTVTGRVSSKPSGHDGFGGAIVVLMEVMSEGAVKDMMDDVNGVADALIPTVEDMAETAIDRMLNDGTRKEQHFMDGALVITTEARILKVMVDRMQDHLKDKMDKLHMADMARKSGDSNVK